MTAPIPLTVTRWQCPHCRRGWSNKARVIPDPTPDEPTVPEPSVCPTCEGEGKLQGGQFWWYCPDCRCDVCGVPTETPPICARCDVAQDAAYERRQDR